MIALEVLAQVAITYGALYLGAELLKYMIDRITGVKHDQR